jgi:multicomponent Na+:H+ antiporter subunit D
VNVLLPLVVAVPLLAAAAIAATGHFLPPRVADLASIVAAASTTIVCGFVLVHSWGGTDVHWFGGWRPRDGVALGIAFVADPLSAGLALFAAALVTAALVFSWHYFDETAPLYHALVLVFLGAMTGFALTGDLFNVFVFFELMGVAAYALTAYTVAQVGPLQGGLAFAVTNSVGGFLILIGIALLYGRTGALNLAQIGETLGARGPDGLVVVAFAFLASGFLVKAAAVPFHFWLADAYAVAPTPICALFSSVMSELGLYALARVYWSAFSGPFSSNASGVRDVLLAVAVASAAVGAVMAFLQRHLKRLLAFVTISHGGLFLAGIALLDPRALAGTSILVVGDGLIKAALFFAVGVVVVRLRSGDELGLRGQGRALPLVGVAFALGGLALAGVPPFTSFLGKSLIEESATELGYAWLPAFAMVVTAVTAGTVWRATARIFAGLGSGEDPLLSPESDEPQKDEPRRIHGRPPLTLIAPVIVLLVLGFGLAFAPDLPERAERAAMLVQNRPAYAATVLEGRPAPEPKIESVETPLSSYLYGAGAVAGAAIVALVGLYRPRFAPTKLRLPAAPVELVRRLHSGHVGDYVTWVVAGTAVLAALLALVLT